LDCIFCKIASGQLRSDIVFEDEDVIAFKDLNPVAPVHLLLIPKKHFESLNDIEKADDALAAKLLKTIYEIARNEGIEAGYRVVTNIGESAGQSVKHLHFHILGGRNLNWPPG